MQSMKMVIVGDGGVGKSCLLISYTSGSFPGDYVPTVFDNYSSTIMMDGNVYSVGFFDTAGQEDYDRLRPLSYPQTDVFLVCFAVNSRTSFENVCSKWIPEITHHAPGVPKVLVGCKSDLLPHTENSRYVKFEEARKMAKTYSMKYFETSALTQKGLKTCMNNAIYEAVNMKPKRSKSLFGSSKQKDRVPPPPEMPPAGKAPWIEIETSVFADQWLKALESPKNADVTFVVDGDRRLDAHKIIVCSASKFFTNVLGLSRHTKSNQLEDIKETQFTPEQLNSGQVEGIAAVYTAKDGHTTVELSADIKAVTFVHVLEFLYTGVPKLPEDDVDQVKMAATLKELRYAARVFKLPQLETICDNIVREEEFLNPSIGTFLNDETAARMKQLFFNQPEYADVVFCVEGQRVYAHKVVLSARCQVMEAMFGKSFIEGSNDKTPQVNVGGTTSECFLALLEYLYTDHAPISETDPVGILILADEYDVTRLGNLCELYITKEVEKQCERNIETSEIDVIGLLFTAQMYNAKQLSDWCLQFISTNYMALSKRKEFAMLTGANRVHVEKERWPPVWYMEEIKEYELRVKKHGETCAIM
ncbi:rho-related protein racA-like [Gigantopelta aegis]|uniref:rho-related protein racA-like n=1 Tax=Gigantopelta aegis TaxID=1735272 RepID=UPI001B889927|nr:rho-related protein racA-like [Gigantopelta aegis]